MTAPEVERLRRGYEAFNELRIDAILDLLHPDVEYRFHVPGQPERVIRGIDEVRGFYELLMQGFEECRVEIDDLSGGEGNALVTGTLHGRAADGRWFEVPFRHRWEFEDGLGVRATFEDPVDPVAYVEG